MINFSVGRLHESIKYGYIHIMKRSINKFSHIIRLMMPLYSDVLQNVLYIVRLSIVVYFK